MSPLFRKKPHHPPTAVHPEVGAELRPVAGLPPRDGAAAGGFAGRRKVRIDGVPPAAVLTDDPNAPTPHAGYVVNGAGEGGPIAFLNGSDGFLFEIWELAPGVAGTPARKRELPPIHPAQGSWLGFHVLDAARLPGNRVLLSVGFFEPRPRTGLGVYRIENGSFTWLSEADPDCGEPYRQFEHRPLGKESAMALYYTGRTRKAAEVYYNQTHHLLLFTPGHPDGLEILTLSIETGNVVNWRMADRTLFLEVADRRDSRRPRVSYWSLDLKALLPR